MGAVSGALSALIFQQGAVALLDALGLSAPLPAPLARLRGARLVFTATAFGALVPTLVALAVVGPLKGQPPMTGVVPLALLVAALLNGIWGLETGLGLRLFGRAT